MYPHLMIDIETIGKGEKPVILSIAAVEFDIQSGETGNHFYRKISKESCIEYGLEVEAATMKWWNNQDEGAREEAFSGTEDLFDVLLDFANFIKNDDNPFVYSLWANSPTFDLRILRKGFEKTGIKNPPWVYRKENCVRSYANQMGWIKKSVDFKGDKHNALDDCYYQIEYLSKMFRQILHEANIERLAAIQHDIIREATRKIVEACNKNSNGDAIIPKSYINKLYDDSLTYDLLVDDHKNRLQEIVKKHMIYGK